MGWSSGTGLACEVYDIVRKHIPEKNRKKIATKIYDLFCDNDADDWDGTSDIEKDADINQDYE